MDQIRTLPRPDLSMLLVLTQSRGGRCLTSKAPLPPVAATGTLQSLLSRPRWAPALDCGCHSLPGSAVLKQVFSRAGLSCVLHLGSPQPPCLKCRHAVPASLHGCLPPAENTVQSVGCFYSAWT